MSADEPRARSAITSTEELHERIAEALCDAWNTEHANGPRDASVPAEWEQEAYAVLEALAGWMERIEQRAEASEAYKQGRADGYAEAYRLFGPELESLRERVLENGRQAPGGES